METTKCPSVDDGIKRRWYIYTMKCYSAIQKDGILPFVTMWMGLENITLRKKKKEKNKNHISL